MFNPAPNALFAIAMLICAGLALLSGIGAAVAYITLPDDKQALPSILWCICTAAMGAFFGLLPQLRVYSRSNGLPPAGDSTPPVSR